MRLGFAIIILTACALFVAGARAESIRWTQPDYEEGDTWEYRVTAFEVAPGWRPLEELWRVGEVRGGCSGAARVDDRGCAYVARWGGQRGVRAGGLCAGAERATWATWAAGGT